MCILFLYANGSPAPGGYKLILASNRDEFYVRPTAAAMQWPETPYAYGGIDMEPGREGGTWLAISGKDDVIKVGALLNVTGEQKNPDSCGRGPIVVNYVTGDKDSYLYSKEIIANPSFYNAFNFVSVEIRSNSAKILHCSNAPPEIISCQEREVHGFGNSPSRTPFKKVQEGKKLFKRIIEENTNKDDLVCKCLDLLKTRTKFWPDEEILRRAPQWGENLSAICVEAVNSGYGSRTNSVILVDWENKMDFYERTMTTTDPYGEWKTAHIQAQLLPEN